jgi:holo-[acyl-carrier protein] synthase
VILGTGIDVIEIARIERAMARHGGRFERRLFTEAERERAARMKRPADHLAACFAAKEAAAKALGTGITKGVGFRQIEVVQEPSGKPVLRLYGEAARLAGAMGATRLHVSLTHAREVASAVVIFEGGGERP